ncbi:MAG: hypothetical protein M1438_02360 [Deltaproteobacteria bacterium]|nr:hypothetical protein [Deltaproteobacteria bacterium]
MTTAGIQTQDFLTRLQKAEDHLPPFLLELARVMDRLIHEIDSPQLKDIRKLHEELRQLIGDAAHLREICGTEGKFCSQCPFGAYLPTGFPYASEKQALCLPWIVVVHPMPSQPEAAN